MVNNSGFPDNQAVFYICNNDKCQEYGNTERLEYFITLDENGWFDGWYRDNGKRIIKRNDDETCPCCGRYRRQKNIKAKLSEKHTCDRRCTEAKGDMCLCSCNGKNHGIKYQKTTEGLLFR